jgi:hypothetical protein
MRGVNWFGLHGNASVIHRSQPFTVRVIRPSVRLEIDGIHGLGCGLGASGQDSEAKIEEMLQPNHSSSLSSRNQIFCGISRDAYTAFVYFYANLEPALTLKSYSLQSLT